MGCAGAARLADGSGEAAEATEGSTVSAPDLEQDEIARWLDSALVGLTVVLILVAVVLLVVRCWL